MLKNLRSNVRRLGLGLLAALLFPTLAFAQDAVDVQLDQALVNQLFDAIAKQEWWLLAGTVVALLTFAVRRYGAGLPLVGDYLGKHPVVGFALPFALAALGALINAKAAGEPVTVGLIAAGKVAMSAIVQFIGVKKLVEAKQGFALTAVIGRVPGEPMRGPQP